MAARRNIGEVDLGAGSTIGGGAIGGGVPQADETTLGGGEVATQAETDTGTDDTRIVTPLKLANYSGIPAAEAFTSGVHASTDHTGITGVSDGETESVTLGSTTSISRTIPGGTLAVDNESLEFEIWGTCISTGTISFTLDATPILSLTTEASYHFGVRGTIIRTGAATQVVTAVGGSGSSGFTKTIRLNSSLTKTLSNPLDLVGAQSVGNHTFLGMTIRKWAA
jgi:hypothetical protein